MPEPSEPVTCAFWTIGPLAESSCMYNVNVTEAALTGATIATTVIKMKTLKQILANVLPSIISDPPFILLNLFP
jgi:hypothetical protein